MKVKVLMIAVILFLMPLIIMVTTVSAQPTYNLTHYDPQDDVMRVRSDGYAKFASLNNVEVTKITSTYKSGDTPQIELTMTVKGTIQNNDSYRYVFIVKSDGDIFIFGSYYTGNPVGFRYGPNPVLVGVTATGESTDTLTILFNEDSIGPPQHSFEVSGVAIFSDGHDEKYIDSVASDRLIRITEPSDGSTVNGTVVVKGVIRESIDGQPNGIVKISIDDGPSQNVNGTDPWSYNLDTTVLNEGAHTIHVKVEGADLDNAEDEITIYVDRDAGSYPSFNQKPEPNIGDWYQYESLGPGNIGGFQMEVISELLVQVLGFENITVGGTEYEAYRIRSKSENNKNLWFIAFQYTADKTSWKEADDFGIVMESTITQVDLSLKPRTTVDKSTQFSPPLEMYNDFSIAAGFDNKWTFNSNVDSSSSTTIGFETHENPPYSENLQIVGECLYYKSSHRIFGSTFYDIYVIQTYYENPGMYTIEYYSPELGVPVQIDTFDPDRNLIASLGLKTWEQVLFSIEMVNVTFEPVEPKADLNNLISVGIKNIGEGDASNITITVTDNGYIIGEENIALILTNQTKYITFNWTPVYEGNYSIRIIASYGDINLTENTFNIEVSHLDLDGDGLPDPWEEEWFGDLSQGPDDDYDGDGHSNLNEYNISDPTDPKKIPSDKDGDTLPDSWEQEHFGNLNQGPDDDFDGDGYSNLVEYNEGYSPSNSLITPEDTDGDSLPDSWEQKYFGDLTQDSFDDYDGDMFHNLQEYQDGTDPTDPKDPPEYEGHESFLSFMSKLWWIFVVAVVITLILLREKPSEKTESVEAEEPSPSPKDNGENEI
jgi:hypothetical protein